MAVLKNIFILFLFISLNVFGQDKAEIFGKITENNNKPVELVNISIFGYSGGTTTGKDGNYKISVPARKELILIVSFVGYESQQFIINLAPGSKKELNIFLKVSTTELPDFEVKDNLIRKTNLTRIDPKIATTIPTISGGVEDLIKTLPGVSSSNELSSQYSVRGGNYDENLVYVNGIEIYRPFLIRSGQQEGLSFINSDLVSSILFSAGGFEAKYGDKMSSVLDIQYKKPTSFAASVSLSLLGAQAHIEGATDNHRLSYLVGFRQKSNQYILKGLETKGDYRPSFTDIQTLINFDITERWEISFLGNYARNSYKLIPQSRETDFGTIQEAYRLKIYYDGQEIDRFETFLGALSATFVPKKDLNIKFIASAYQTFESETFDIQGQYWLGKLETDFGNEEFGDVIEAQGVGTYLTHARNYLDATVFNVEHKGILSKSNKFFQWGIKYQHEIIHDKLNEWELIDSAGFTIPNPPGSVGNPNPLHPDLDLFGVVRTDINISSNRYTGFIQNTWDFLGKNRRFSVTAGIRGNYWDFNKQFLFSPRATVSYKPNWKKDIVLRFSAGYYYQPPFYRELRDFAGNINYDIKAQKSIHFVAGGDWNFMAWSRPFKFVTEVYYKYLDNLIPYEIDNLRIRYYAQNNSHGYAVGIDMRVNGEFVKGIESWASLSIMQTMEDIEDDFYYDYYNAEGELIIPGYTFDVVAVDSLRQEPGYIPRPTDQRVNFSLFFQDFLPKFPTYKMYLKLIFGSSLPFGPPNSEKYKHTLRIPPYRRVDIGFSKQVIGEKTQFSPKNPLRYLKSLWVSLEVFNLLQVSNTISYLWVKDVNNRMYAIPNYLTPRQLNVRLLVAF
jgi:hypothetical protein